MQHHLRWVPLALAAVAVMPLTGCLKLHAQLVAQPDLSFVGTILIGMDARLIESMGPDAAPFAGLKSGPIGESWSVREFEKDGWRYAEATGVGPVEGILPGDESGAPKVQVTRTFHRLTTRYTVTMTLPEMAPEALPMPPGPEEAGEGQKAEIPDLQGAVAAMLSGVEFRFALGGPGRVVSTNGTVVGDGLAEWRPAIHEVESGNIPTMQVTTETINWTHLGRLADQIAGLGGGDAAGTKLADALARGLLPNPPVSDLGTGKLEAADYMNLLAIIARLDDVLEPQETAEVMRELGLSSDSATSAQIAAAHARAQASGFADQVRSARVGKALDGLRP